MHIPVFLRSDVLGVLSFFSLPHLSRLAPPPPPPFTINIHPLFLPLPPPFIVNSHPHFFSLPPSSLFLPSFLPVSSYPIYGGENEEGMDVEKGKKKGKGKGILCTCDCIYLCF